jgi:hypothetical protein
MAVLSAARPVDSSDNRQLTRLGDLLRQPHPDLLISRRRHRQVAGIELLRQQREQGTQTLCFSSRPFVLCGLPV